MKNRISDINKNVDVNDIADKYNSISGDLDWKENNLLGILIQRLNVNLMSLLGS